MATNEECVCCMEIPEVVEKMNELGDPNLLHIQITIHSTDYNHLGSCSPPPPPPPPPPVDVITKPRPQQEVFITWIFDSSYLPEEWTFKHQSFFVVYMALELLIIVKKMRIFFSRYLPFNNQIT